MCTAAEMLFTSAHVSPSAMHANEVNGVEVGANIIHRGMKGATRAFI